MTRPRMAVGTWAWVFGPYARRPVPLADVLRDVRAIGYDGVELTGRPHAHPGDLPTPEARRGLARLVADHGLAIASLGGPVGGGSPLVVERGAYLDSDTVFGVKEALIADFSGGRLTYTFRIQEA